MIKYSNSLCKIHNTLLLYFLLIVVRFGIFVSGHRLSIGGFERTTLRHFLNFIGTVEGYLKHVWTR